MMDRSMSRRRMVTWGAAGAVGAALPLVAAGTGHADPQPFNERSNLVFDVTRFGARGDGVRIDTDAINAAIDAAARAGGGTVYFPAGTYASYSILLRSNVALSLALNATLLAAAPANGRGYDPAEQPGAGNPFQDFGH